jgi:cell division septation protein DedD
MPLVDRILRGPLWVMVVGALLAGIVFLNVSVLELNRGIAKTDAAAATLERANSSLRGRVAKLDSGERIQQLATRLGFVMPQPGDVTFVRSHRTDAKLAAARISVPSPSGALPATTTPIASTPTTTPTTPSTTTTTPAPVQPAPVQPAPTTQTQAQPAQQAPVAQVTPAAPSGTTTQAP